MNVLHSFLVIFGTTLVGILTVPVFDGLKKLLSLQGKLPAWVQQILVTGMAFAIASLGTVLNQVLPPDLAMFSADTVQGILSGALALAIKAGQKADANK